MIWPPDKLGAALEPNTAPGYVIRTYRPGDEAHFLSLMAKMDFDPWDDEKLRYNMARIIPDGWFFAVERASESIVGTAMCLHNYTGSTPFTGDVGWLVCDPCHRGHRLGYSLTAYVTARFVHAGYARIQLHTEYYRLPAVKIYLTLGYLPVIRSREMYCLWQEVCEQIGWEFTPDAWSRREWTRQQHATDARLHTVDTHVARPAM